MRDDDLFVAATNNYRSGGGGNFPDLGVEAVIAESGQSVRDLLAGYLAEGMGVEIPPPPSWQFCPVPGASVLIETSPRARSAAEDIARLGLRDLGDNAQGFACFELSLDRDQDHISPEFCASCV